MDVNKNSYTFGFAAIMVVLVATLLSAAAISLKPFQDKNIEAEKKQNILSTVGIKLVVKMRQLLTKKILLIAYVLNNKGENREGMLLRLI